MSGDKVEIMEIVESMGGAWCHGAFGRKVAHPILCVDSVGGARTNFGQERFHRCMMIKLTIPSRGKWYRVDGKLK